MQNVSTVLPSTAVIIRETAERLTPRQTCTTLIKLVARCNQTAFAELYDNTSGLLFGLLLRILGDSKTAEEILEDVYAEVWQQAGEFAEQRGEPLIWLIIIAHRRGIERLQQITSEQRGVIRRNDSGKNSSAAFDANDGIADRQRLVRSAINALAPLQRQMLELAYFSGMKEDEIAAYLGFEPETVRLSTSLAMKKLTSLLSFLDSPESLTNAKSQFPGKVV